MYNIFVARNIAWHAGVAEPADALDSGSSGGNFVEVQVLLPAPAKQDTEGCPAFLCVDLTKHRPYGIMKQRYKRLLIGEIYEDNTLVAAWCSAKQ